jgi:hypothetical protein
MKMLSEYNLEQLPRKIRNRFSVLTTYDSC